MFGLRLKKPIGTAYATDGDDVVKMKTALRDLGEYQAPAFGITPHADGAMFEGLRRVQKKAGLAVDGVAKPGGPTELTLNADLARGITRARAGRANPVGGPSPSRSRTPSDGGTVRADAEIAAIGKRLAKQGRARDQGSGQGVAAGGQTAPARGQGLRLRGGVGVNQPNSAADITALKTALAWTGHYTADHKRLADPRPDEDLHWSLMGFQRDFNLTQDGYARPGGETETRFNTLIEPLIQLASFGGSQAGQHPGSGHKGAAREPSERLYESEPEAGIFKVAGGEVVQEPAGDANNPADMRSARTVTVLSPSAPDRLTMPDERRASILNNTPSVFVFDGDGTTDDRSPWWEDKQRGIDAVREHDEIIQEMANKHSVDADLVRAIMFMENARGHWFGLNDLADQVGLSDTVMPMNINPELWGGLLGEGADFRDPKQNIEAATILISRISDRLEDPTPEAVASVWNYLGRESPNDLGAYVRRIYMRPACGNRNKDIQQMGVRGNVDVAADGRLGNPLVSDLKCYFECPHRGFRGSILVCRRRSGFRSMLHSSGWIWINSAE